MIMLRILLRRVYCARIICGNVLGSLEAPVVFLLLLSIVLNMLFVLVLCWQPMPVCLQDEPLTTLPFSVLPKRLAFLNSTALDKAHMRLPERTTFEKRMYTKRMRLTHVVMPFHERQRDRAIQNLQSWTKYAPCAAGRHDLTLDGVASYYRRKRDADSKDDLPLGHNITFIFFLNTKRDRMLEEQLLAAFDELPKDVQSCFSGALVRWAALEPSLDDYIKGSRMMFQEILNGYLGVYEPMYVLQMEPDALPMRPHWLSLVDATTRYPNPNFWIKGTFFTGAQEALRQRSVLLNLFHLNGNALFFLGDHGLRDFYFHQVCAYNFRRVPDVAYDMGIFRYLLDPLSYNASRHLAHKFQYSRFIQNPWHSNYSVADIRNRYELTAIVHSGYRQP